MFNTLYTSAYSSYPIESQCRCLIIRTERTRFSRMRKNLKYVLPPVQMLLAVALLVWTDRCDQFQAGHGILISVLSGLEARTRFLTGVPGNT